jgi:hypothetical protein
MPPKSRKPKKGTEIRGEDFTDRITKRRQASLDERRERPAIEPAIPLDEDVPFRGLVKVRKTPKQK